MYKMKILLLLLSFLAVFSGLFGNILDDLKIELRGGEVFYGPYDIGADPIISFEDWKFLIIKPVFVRFDPFDYTFAAGSIVEYYPLTQFDLSYWFFSDRLLNPYVYTGYKVLMPDLSLVIPVGIGFQAPVFDNFYMGLRVYLSMAVLPSFYPSVNWEFSFEYKIRGY